MAQQVLILRPIEEGKHRCDQCGAVVPSEAAPRHRCGRAPLPARGACAHRGDELRREKCPSCAGNVELKVFACALHQECAIGKAPAGVRSCELCRDFAPRAQLPVIQPQHARHVTHPRTVIPRPAGGNFANAFAYDGQTLPEFVTLARFTRDIHHLATLLPADTARIVGVARSGLVPASLVAQLLHRELWIVRQSSGDLVEGGNGWRLTGQRGDVAGKTVLIDDTVMTGNSLRAVLPILRDKFRGAISATVYCNPRSAIKPDIFARPLPWPHLLEWNLFNSVLSPHVACDFDGILCRDCTGPEDDDGPRYARFLETAEPLYPIRKVTIPLIVTARLEKYRAATLAWLDRHGMIASKLIMHRATTLRERRGDDIAAFKARHFREFIARTHKIKPPLFVESDPGQAARIAELSRGLVVCPAAGRCFQGGGGGHHA